MAEALRQSGFQLGILVRPLELTVLAAVNLLMICALKSTLELQLVSFRRSESFVTLEQRAWRARRVDVAGVC